MPVQPILYFSKTASKKFKYVIRWAILFSLLLTTNFFAPCRWYFAVISMSGVFAVTFSVIFAYVADITQEHERSTAYGLVRKCPAAVHKFICFFEFHHAGQTAKTSSPAVRLFFQVSATFAASLVTSPAIGAYLSVAYGDTLVVILATVISLLDICFILVAVPESLPEKMRPASWGAPISWEQADPFAVSWSHDNRLEPSSSPVSFSQSKSCLDGLSWKYIYIFFCGRACFYCAVFPIWLWYGSLGSEINKIKNKNKFLANRNALELKNKCPIAITLFNAAPEIQTHCVGFCNTKF